MKFNFRKVASVIASVVMLGSTIGLAAAANYPAPFVSSGTANVGVVVGASAAVTDWSAALDIAQSLQYELAKQTAVAGSATGGSATGGDSYKLEKSSTRFHLGRGMYDVVSSSVTDDNLPTLLADGVFVDDDNDEFDFTQTMTLYNLSATMFEDNDYKADEPTPGMRIASGAYMMNYTLDFSDTPLWADLPTADMTVLGKSYYVLSATANTTLTLLDSAETILLSEGETKTVSVGGVDYVVTPSIFGSTTVKLSVNGEITNSLSTGQTYKLSSGAYVGVKDVVIQNYAGGAKQVEFSIGKGKLKLTDGSDVELNDEAISDFTVDLQSTTASSADALQKVIFIWKAEDDMFVTADSEAVMPGFEAVKLTSSGFTWPAQEKIVVTYDGDDSFKLDNFPLKDSVEDISLLHSNGTEFDYIGKDSTHQLRTDNDTTITFNGDTDDYFVGTYVSGSDAESYLMKATNFKIDNSVNKTTIQYRKDQAWVDAKADGKEADTVTVGNVILTLGQVSKNEKTVVLTLTSGGNFNTLYSKEGMRVILPFDKVGANTQATQGGIGLATDNNATFSLIFSEEDIDETKGAGSNITATLSLTASDADATVSAVAGSPNQGTFTEILDTDTYRNYVYGPLATEMVWDKSADEYKLELTYHGDESWFDVWLAAPSVTTTAGSGATSGSVTALGSVTVSDAEYSKVSSKNVIVVGGSCINSVAATLLGGAKCGADFTTATDVGAGQFLIQSFASSTDKVALVVAGYDAADTENAVKYLTTQTVDTTAGKKYKGTSATSASLVTA